MVTGDGNLHTYRNTHMQVTHISHNITLMTLTTFCIVYISYTCSRIACIAYSKKVKDIYILNFLWTYHHRVVYVVAFVKYRMHNINKLINSFLVINIAKFIIINRVNEVVIATCMFASFHVCRSVLLFQKYSLLILVFGHTLLLQTLVLPKQDEDTTASDLHRPEAVHLSQKKTWV